MNIEHLLRTALSDRLPVPVWLEQPTTKPERYVLLEKLGGGERQWISSATIAVQSHAESLWEASVLNDLAKKALQELVRLPNISRVALNSDYNFTDPETKQYRYQAVFDIIYMEV